MTQILITGDVYLGDPHIEELAEKGETHKLFGDVLPEIQKSDFAITNLESPITNKNLDRIQKTGPYLKSSVKSLNVLRKAGFNMVTLANNHILDYGKQGISSTLDACKGIGMDYVGAGNSKEEAILPARITLNGKSITILNFAENEFSTIGVTDYGANPINLIDNCYDIKREKELSDIVIVIVHGGREHYPFPSPHFKKTLRFFADNGADAVISHHTHCVSGYEVYNNTPIFYGLGNFLFKNLGDKHKRPLWDIGLAVKLIISDSGNVSFDNLLFRQCENSGPKIKLIKGSDKDEFCQILSIRNQIIADDKLLQKEWENYIITQKDSYKNLIFIKNKWLRKFVSRNVLPRSAFMNKKHTTHLINLVKCETHHEILLESLKDEL